MAGCGVHDFRSEEFSHYYVQPNESQEKRNLERKRILHWTQNPKHKSEIGMMERWEITLEGSRTPREHYVILDPSGVEQIGFIDEEGRVYRFNARGERILVGEYPVVDTGLKMFFGLPLKDNLDLEDVDPYRDY